MSAFKIEIFQKNVMIKNVRRSDGVRELYHDSSDLNEYIHQFIRENILTNIFFLDL